jgi:methyl-accepting chemotaxis protein
MTDNQYLLVTERSNAELSFNNEGGEYILEGIFGEIGVKNKNNRIYDESEYVPQIKSLQEKIKGGKLLGELDHPANFDISLRNASHVIETLEYDQNSKQVRGRIRLLNTSSGREAKALVDAGVPIHISSRAAGVVESNGHVKIKKLFTYDLVADPGFENAELKRVNESFGLDLDDSVQIFELPGDFNYDKYNITENNNISMSEYIKNEDFNKYTQYLAGEFAKIQEQFKVIKESNSNDTNEGVIKYAEHIAEKMNQLHAYTSFIAENLDNVITHNDHVVEGVNNMERYMNYVAERADQGIQYAESVAERADQGIQYAESIAEKSEKIIEFSNYIAENMDKIAQHNDYLTEGLNNVVKFADYLKENLETVGGYSNYVGENLDKLNKRLTGVSEQAPVVTASSTPAPAAVTESIDEYKKSIQEKLQILIESAQKPTADTKGDLHFLDFLTEDKKKQYKSLNETVKNELVQTYNSSKDYFSGNVANEIFESVVSKTSNVPDFILRMPVEYKDSWNNLSNSRKTEIVAESRRYNLATDYQLNNFWQTRDLRNTQVQVERINESKVAANEEVKGYAVSGSFLEGFENQLKGRFAKFTK